MWGLDYAKLKVGDRVAIAYSGSWTTQSQGVYKVVKANKLKVILQRESDGYQREFSVKRRVELGVVQISRFDSAFIESVEDMQRREAQYAAERDRRQAWTDAEQAARNKDLVKLKDIVAKLEQMAV